MKPIVIFRHSSNEGPGYFATFLEHHSLPWQLIRIDARDEIPIHVNQFSGLVFMGGIMSVNDTLPWIPKCLNLIRDAIDQNIPVLGHCLGGQLMAKALGGTVNTNPVKEIGWGSVLVADNDETRHWFGNIPSFLSFHWHQETFSVPEGFTHILSSPYCHNQAFSCGPHLSMQCHVEMTQEMLETWCRNNRDNLTKNNGPSIQTAQAMHENITEKIDQLNAVANRLYSQWIKELKL